MKLDVVIPTYNRADLLRATLLSLLRPQPPQSLGWRVTVVDNNSTDHTQKALQELAPAFDGKLNWVLETRPGCSHARNTGIESTEGEVIAFLDDDEEITDTWFQALYDYFQDPDVDYIGGPMLPNWKAEPPPWLPVWEYNGVLSIFDLSSEPVDYGPGFPGMLISGNCAFRRATLEQVGPYRADLGRGPVGLGAGEDHDLSLRLKKAGCRGVYVPKLAILHLVPKERLSAGYYRHWIWGQSISQARIGKETGVALWLGIPRYRFGNLARRTLSLAWNILRVRATRKELFIFELECRRIVGLLYGTHGPAAR
jgi:glucosyl-dolichyl phosphate glucuronosyltransferase